MAKDKNNLLNNDVTADKSNKNAQARLQEQNRQVMTVEFPKGVRDKVMRFAKSPKAPEKLQGQWCYKFMSANGCQDQDCSRTHVPELASTDLCIGWLTKGV